MVEKVDNDIEFSEHLFKTSLKILSKKRGNKYNFIIKSGPSLKSALFKLFKVVWEQEKKPDLWRNTNLIQLFKGRGYRSDMNNMRNLHTKQDIPKFFGHIVASAAKPHLNENIRSVPSRDIGPKNTFLLSKVSLVSLNTTNKRWLYRFGIYRSSLTGSHYSMVLMNYTEAMFGESYTN